LGGPWPACVLQGVAASVLWGALTLGPALSPRRRSAATMEWRCGGARTAASPRCLAWTTSSSWPRACRSACRHTQSGEAGARAARPRASRRCAPSLPARGTLFWNCQAARRAQAAPPAGASQRGSDRSTVHSRQGRETGPPAGPPRCARSSALCRRQCAALPWRRLANPGAIWCALRRTLLRTGGCARGETGTSRTRRRGSSWERPPGA
jgi:hypothetical protein